VPLRTPNVNRGLLGAGSEYYGTIKQIGSSCLCLLLRIDSKSVLDGLCISLEGPGAQEPQDEDSARCDKCQTGLKTKLLDWLDD